MLNEAQISLTGYVATQPVTRYVKTGAMTLTMRVAWTPRRQDRVSGEWVDGNTSYVTVVCWRRLATNVAICVRKGDPVVVKGRLSVRSYDDKEGVTRTAVEVEASSVGHDLSRGVASFQRVRPQTGMTASEFAASQAAASASAESGDAAQGGSASGAQAPSENGTAASEGAWPGYGDDGIPLPHEPEDSFLDDSLLNDPAAGPSEAGQFVAAEPVTGESMTAGPVAEDADTAASIINESVLSGR